jgi:hypothetical protein
VWALATCVAPSSRPNDLLAQIIIPSGAVPRCHGGQNPALPTLRRPQRQAVLETVHGALPRGLAPQAIAARACCFQRPPKSHRSERIAACDWFREQIPPFYSGLVSTFVSYWKIGTSPLPLLVLHRIRSTVHVAAITRPFFIVVISYVLSRRLRFCRHAKRSSKHCQYFEESREFAEYRSHSSRRDTAARWGWESSRIGSWTMFLVCGRPSVTCLASEAYAMQRERPCADFEQARPDTSTIPNALRSPPTARRV